MIDIFLIGFMLLFWHGCIFMLGHAWGVEQIQKQAIKRGFASIVTRYERINEIWTHEAVHTFEWKDSNNGQGQETA